MSVRGAAAAAAILVAACGREAPPNAPAVVETAPPSNAVAPAQTKAEPRTDSLSERLDAIDAAVRAWGGARDLATARRNAEAARNLVVGGAGPYYGDGDGDGRVAGATAVGLLPGLDGQPGFASASPNACVVRDVLGGSWSDPARRWRILESAIAAWSPASNPFPSLPSHPQRVVGWATLALGADDLATARDHARHARLHVDISVRAVRACGEHD